MPNNLAYVQSIAFLLEKEKSFKRGNKIIVHWWSSDPIGGIGLLQDVNLSIDELEIEAMFLTHGKHVTEIDIIVFEKEWQISFSLILYYFGTECYYLSYYM